VPEIEKNTIPVSMGDGAQSAITIYSGRPDKSSPVVLCVPALGVAGEFYEPFCVAGIEHGWIGAISDLRGNGNSSVRPSRQTDFGYHEMIAYDLPAYIEALKREFPSNPFFILGHSLGGQLSALYLSMKPEGVTGLILLTSCSVFFCGWNFPRNIGVLFVTQFFRIAAELFGYFPGRKLGFGGIEARQVMRDWANEALTGRYRIANSSHNFETLLGKMKTPVLAINFDNDFFAPKKAADYLLRKLGSAPLTQWYLSEDDLGPKRVGHFQWARNPEPLATKIDEWIRDISLRSNVA
jgi:predicted alpha/beta hydrolase